MKKIAQIAIMFFVMITLFSCSNGSEIKEPTQNPDGNGATTNPEEKPTKPGSSTSQGTQGDQTLLKFDFKGASVIASVEATKSYGRAAADTTDDAPLVAIEENGTTRPVIISDYLEQLPKIQMLAKAPTADSEYVYIVFESAPYIYISNEITKEDEYGNKYTYTESKTADIGRVLCVHEDGTFTNVVSNGESFEYFNSELQFDGDGNLYYCTSDSGNGSYSQVVCKYNPQTNTKTRISAPIEGTSYSKMQISNDGAWLFVQGSRYSDGGMGTSFLRAIPTASPENYKNLYYSSDWNGCEWIYHNDDIYVAEHGSDRKIKCFYKENGAYSQDACETILGNDVQTGSDYFYIWNMLGSNLGYRIKELTTVYGYDDSNGYWQCENKEFYLMNDDGSINATELLNSFLYSLTDKTDDAGNHLSIESLSEKYDFRFDKFAAVEGFKLLAELADGKKNAEAFEAVFSSQEAINTLFAYNGRYSYDSSIESYRNNFLADILYLKDTDTLLDDSGTNFFTKKGGGKYYSNNNVIDFLYQVEGYNVYYWQNDYKNDDGSVNAQKVLDTFFTACNRNGEKEFRLSAFKDDETYGALYSELKDTDAIEFISQSKERMNLLYDCANNCFEFVAKTCFIKGTDKPAYSGSSENYFECIETFAAINYGSLYAVAKTWDNSKYIYKILKLLDSNGNQCAEWIDCDVTISGTSKLIPSGNSFYFKNPILTSGGDETGFQKLLSLNADTGSTVDLLENADGGSDNLEITSFSADATTVYFSAVRGIDIVNGMVDTATLKVTPVSSNAKFTNILSLK